MDNGLSRTPPMGFNTWYYYTDRFDENLIKAIADKLVSTGLADLGYRYYQIDYGWCVKREGIFLQEMKRVILLPDPQKFPNGIESACGLSS